MALANGRLNVIAINALFKAVISRAGRALASCHDVLVICAVKRARTAAGSPRVAGAVVAVSGVVAAFLSMIQHKVGANGPFSAAAVYLPYLQLFIERHRASYRLGMEFRREGGGISMTRTVRTGSGTITLKGSS